MSDQQGQSSIWSIEHLNLAIKAAGIALWSWNVDTDRLELDARARELWDLPDGSSVTFEDLSEHIHPRTATG